MVTHPVIVAHLVKYLYTAFLYMSSCRKLKPVFVLNEGLYRRKIHKKDSKQQAHRLPSWISHPTPDRDFDL